MNPQEFSELVSEVKGHLLRQMPDIPSWVSAAAKTKAASQRDEVETLEKIRENLGECTRCRLHQGRTKIVFGQGDPKSRLMFVGEGPGAEEDRQGLAFVGKAGQLLTRIIAAIGLTRDEVYIANIVKCRPPQNRDPQEDEITTCIPFLKQQIRAIQPLIICTLGAPASKTLLQTSDPISRLRGRFYEVDGVQIMPTYHPAYLLRNPSEKRPVWEDMQKIQKKLTGDGLA
jgi:uracil-DNA glycosylase family 4